jgi:hypothetical protein
MTNIIIKMDGGLIQDILNIPPGIEIEVRDYYATEGDDDGRILTDEEGKRYYPTLWEHEKPLPDTRVAWVKDPIYPEDSAPWRLDCPCKDSPLANEPLASGYCRCRCGRLYDFAGKLIEDI